MLALDVAAVFAELVACNDPDLIHAGKAAGCLDSLLPSVLMAMPTLYLLLT